MWLNKVTFASFVKVVARIVALEEGIKVHVGILKIGFDSGIFAGSSLVDMYPKCRVVEDARKVFDNIPEWNVVLWIHMIAGYDLNGNDEEALTL